MATISTISRKKPSSWDYILLNLNNEQKKRVLKVYNEVYYVLESKESESGSKTSIFVSGSSKSVYCVQISKEMEGYTITCNCPDSLTHAAKHNVICKHCCFVILVVGQIHDPFPISIAHLNIKQYSAILSRINHNSDLVDKKLKEKYDIVKTHEEKTETKLSKFDSTISTKQVDETDECPICYDLLSVDVTRSCPECNNHFHSRCIEKWLQTKLTCVLCRSDVWKKYKNEEKKTIKDTYIHL